jgi:hypothetical protein
MVHGLQKSALIGDAKKSQWTSSYSVLLQLLDRPTMLWEKECSDYLMILI